MNEVKRPKKPLIVFYTTVLVLLLAFNLFILPALVQGSVTSRDFWVKNMSVFRQKWIEFLDYNPDVPYRYGNAHVSRCYIRYEDKNNSSRWFNRLMRLWDGRDLVIVEGEKTRLGCGNDFLKNARTIRRILGPSENAFQKRHELLNYIKEGIEKDALIILALGPTATVMAYELSQSGYQALDLGHCDIEYEWYLRGVMEKIAIDGKYTNEVQGGNAVSATIEDQLYERQIIAKFD